MSRIRIVKGKITEIIGGDLCYYSEGDIVEIAAETYSEKSAGKILYGDNPRKPLSSPTLTKCAVFFRPTKEWKGEFGFDWSRVGDSKLQVDNAYDGIVGKYGKIYATLKGAKFTADNNQYKNVLKEYNSFRVYEGNYHVPNMTLNIGETALLDAIVHVEEKADKLHLEYNRDVFELTLLKKFTIAKGENYDEKALKIKCKKTFSTSETIKVIATKNKLTQKVGEINVLPNDKIKSVNILIIPVKYSGKRGSIKNLKEKEYIINSFGQALIRATIEDYPFELIVGDLFSDLFFTTKDKKGNKVMDISSYKSIHQYLDDKFMNIKGNNKYDSYYRVYCLPSSLNLNGIAEDVGNGAKAVVVFQNRDNYTTMIHEILHAVGLYHTFDNNAKHTFKLYGTDNIMDYTHHKGKNRFTTTCWQWKVLRKNIKL